jgi:hypothetical protein
MVVKRIEAKSFRGIPGHFALDLVNDNNKTQTILLHGDNGSGKSSIVDAIEFGLRGRLSRRGLEGKKQKREVRNLLDSGAPGVLLTMDTGRRIRRGGGIRDPQLLDSGAEFTEGFEYCPVVVRRHDVESFWTIPSANRQEFFFDYLRDPSEVPRDVIMAELNRKKLQAENKLQSTKNHFFKVTKKTVQLPRTHKASEEYFKTAIVTTYGEPKNGRLFVPPKIYRAYIAFQRALLTLESATSAQQNGVPEILLPQRIKEVLEKVSGRVSQDFTEVTKKDWVNQVQIELDDQAGLDIQVVLSNGQHADPVQVLNEAALDLLALLILVEVHIECSELGQRKLLVLDDVFQSVDSVHRIRALDHVMQRLQGWQVLLTLHDRLWLELARTSIQRNGGGAAKVIEVRSTPHDQVPELIVTGNGPLSKLEILLTQGAPTEVITAMSGRTLEQLADSLSISLGTSITRRQGDKYTLGDLWPGVQKVLRKTEDASIKSAAETVEQFLALRNLAGAHYNEWAESLTYNEASDFSNSVISLWKSVTCPKCGALLSSFRPPRGSRTIYTLPCKC